MKNNPLTWKLFFLIVSTDVLDSISQLFMKKGLVATGIGSVNLSNALDFIWHNASSPMVWLGLLCYAFTFFIWIVVLCQVDLSVALPLGSTSYIMIPIIAIIFLKESISPLRWVGIVLVIMGIHFVSKSKQQIPPVIP